MRLRRANGATGTGSGVDHRIADQAVEIGVARRPSNESVQIFGAPATAAKATASLEIKRQ
jgi:hypothetical protein